MRLRLLLGLSLAVLLAPVETMAQGYFAPAIGVDYSGDAGQCPSLFTDCTEKKTSYGLAIGGLRGGAVGFEQLLTYSPDFFGKSVHFGDNSVLTAMSNLVIAIPVGRLRPFASGGVGIIRTKVGFTFDQLVTSFSNTSLGYNIGGGLMFFLPGHIGLRLDVRRVRSWQETEIAGIPLAGNKLGFNQASIGLILH